MFFLYLFLLLESEYTTATVPSAPPDLSLSIQPLIQTALVVPFVTLLSLGDTKQGCNIT